MDRLKTLRTKSLKTWLLPGALGLLLFVIAACGGGATATPETTAQTGAASSSGTTTTVVETTQSNPQVFPDDTEADRLVAAQETVMNRIFRKALPSVVNIQVIQGREGNDGHGGGVRVGARVKGAAATGEILVSDIGRGLARTSAGVEFDDRGEHELKGIAEPQRLFAVRDEG